VKIERGQYALVAATVRGLARGRLCHARNAKACNWLILDLGPRRDTRWRYPTDSTRSSRDRPVAGTDVQVARTP